MAALVARPRTALDGGGMQPLDADLVAQHLQPAQFFLPGAAVHRHHVAGQRIGRSEEHTSELQSLMRISYAVFCLKKKNTPTRYSNNTNELKTHKYKTSNESLKTR